MANICYALLAVTTDEGCFAIMINKMGITEAQPCSSVTANRGLPPHL